MFEGLTYITLSGEKYPIKCDMLVLEKIQDKYENLSSYENKLSGFVPTVEEDGSFKRNKEGHMIGTYEIPKITILNEALVWMVLEGLEIETEQQGKERKELDEKRLLRMVDMSPGELGKVLHKEFARCFVRKNEETT